MALSVAVFVGKSDSILDNLIHKAKNLKVGGGYDSKTDVGPISYV